MKKKNISTKKPVNDEVIELHHFNVLYVCNEINLCLIFDEIYTHEDFQKEKITFEDVCYRIIGDLSEETLSIIDNQLTLKSNCSKFLVTHVIEDMNSTNFKLKYIDLVDNFIDVIKDCNNLVKYDDEDNYQYVTCKNLKDIEPAIEKHTSLENYKSIKNIMILENSFEFFPYCIWTKKESIEKSKIKIVKQKQEFILENFNHKRRSR